MSTTVIMHTSEGDITINLFDDLAPETVANFVGLATGEKTWRDPMTGGIGPVSYTHLTLPTTERV